MSTKSPPQRLQGRIENPNLWVMRKIWDRLNVRNEHFVGCIVGREGDGKSYSALKIASLIDPEFTAADVYFRLDNFLEMLRDEEYEEGKMYVLDESGVSLGNRTWADRDQVKANQALQLIRSHNIGLVFTLPRLGELDSQAQGRLQALFEITEKVENPSEDDPAGVPHVVGKWKWMQPDRTDETGKIYKKFPRRRANGRTVKITELAFTPPHEGLAEDYEVRKAPFQKEVYDATIGGLRDGEEEEDAPSPEELANEIIEAGTDEYVSEHGQTGRRFVDKDLLRAEYGLSHSDANATKKLIERKADEI